MIKLIPVRNKDCQLKHLQRKLKQLAKHVVPTYVIKERKQKSYHKQYIILYLAYLVVSSHQICCTHSFYVSLPLKNQPLVFALAKCLDTESKLTVCNELNYKTELSTGCCIFHFRSGSEELKKCTPPSPAVL